MKGQSVHLVERSRSLARRVAIRIAQTLGPARNIIPFRDVWKRALGIQVAAPSARETSREARLSAFMEARALNGNIDEAGLVWLIDRAPLTQLALNCTDDFASRQIETVLTMMGVNVSSDKIEFERMLPKHAIIILKSRDARIAAVRARADRVADIVVLGFEPGEDRLQFGGMTVLPGPRLAETV